MGAGWTSGAGFHLGLLDIGGPEHSFGRFSFVERRCLISIQYMSIDPWIVLRCTNDTKPCLFYSALCPSCVRGAAWKISYKYRLGSISARSIQYINAGRPQFTILTHGSLSTQCQTSGSVKSVAMKCSWGLWLQLELHQLILLRRSSGGS